MKYDYNAYDDAIKNLTIIINKNKSINFDKANILLKAVRNIKTIFETDLSREFLAVLSTAKKSGKLQVIDRIILRELNNIIHLELQSVSSKKAKNGEGINHYIRRTNFLRDGRAKTKEEINASVEQNIKEYKNQKAKENENLNNGFIASATFLNNFTTEEENKHFLLSKGILV